MKHLTEDQIMRIARCYSECMPYEKEDLEAIEHIGECDECYNSFCCAVVIHEATSEEALSAVFPELGIEVIEAELDALEPSHALAVIRVITAKAADKVKATMEQIGSIMDGWVFGQPMAMAGSRGASDEENEAVAVMENEDSKFTTVRYDATTGNLTVSIDTAEMENVPSSVVIRNNNGKAQEIKLSENGRFMVAEISGLNDSSFEIVLL